MKKKKKNFFFFFLKIFYFEKKKKILADGLARPVPTFWKKNVFFFLKDKKINFFFFFFKMWSVWFLVNGFKKKNKFIRFLESCSDNYLQNN